MEPLPAGQVSQLPAQAVAPPCPAPRHRAAPSKNHVGVHVILPGNHRHRGSRHHACRHASLARARGALVVVDAMASIGAHHLAMAPFRGRKFFLESKFLEFELNNARPARFATLRGGFAGLTCPWTTGTAIMGLQIEEAIGRKRQMLWDTRQVHRFIPFSVDFLISKRKVERRRLLAGSFPDRPSAANTSPRLSGTTT